MNVSQANFLLDNLLHILYLLYYKPQTLNALLRQLENDNHKRAIQVNSKKVGQNQDVRPPSGLFVEQRGMAE